MTVFSRALTFLLLALVVAAVPACRKPAAPAGAGAVPSALAEAAPVTAPLPAAQADSAGYAFTPAERTAVDEFLRRHSDLRLARDSDRQESRDEEAETDVRRLYGVYHPYFVRGDLNDDGILDFVLAFVRRDSSRDTPWFSVVVFTGRSERGSLSFAAGAFIERDITLARGDLSIDRDAVLITPDLTDESVRRYRWDPLRRSYVFVRDDAEEDDTPIPSRT
jgi:hypothetical protein